MASEPDPNQRKQILNFDGPVSLWVWPRNKKPHNLGTCFARAVVLVVAFLDGAVVGGR